MYFLSSSQLETVFEMTSWDEHIEICVFVEESVYVCVFTPFFKSEPYKCG